MTEINKKYISPDELMEASLQLAHKIFASGFRPDYIVALWRGGTPVGVVIQELFEYFGMRNDHLAIKTSYYSGLDQVKGEVQVHGLEYLVRNMTADKSMLLVDDVFDSGNSINAVLAMLDAEAPGNKPRDIRIATAYYKPLRNQMVNLVPDYFVHETDEWLVFPHELVGLSRAEIANSKPLFAQYMAEIDKTI